MVARGSSTLRDGPYSIAECAVGPAGGVLLHRRRDMAVKVERRADRRMPEALLRDLRMHASQQKLRCVAVAKIVETDPREVSAESSQEPRKLVNKALRL